MAQAQDWFSANAPTPPPTSGDWFASNAPAPEFKQTDTSPNEVDPNTLGTFVRHLWAGVNPVQIGQMLPFPKSLGGSGVDNPLNPAKIVKDLAAVKKQADEALSKGEYTKALTHYVESVVPILGPMMARQGDELQAGKYTAAAGDMTALAANIVAPKAIGGLARPAPAVARDAVTFAQDRGIPLDAATVTDNLAVKGTQAIADRTVGGSLVSTPARTRQASAMVRVGDELATEAHPTPTTPEGAGTSLRDALTAKVSEHNATATQAYDKLRALEAQNVAPKTTSTVRAVDTGILDAAGQPVSRDVTTSQTTPMAVDVTRAKQALKPLYDSLKRQSELVPLQGDKGRALVALDRLLNGPDVAPLSVVDPALGDLKSMARADIPELRTQGQGMAAVAVQQLDAAVRQTAMRAGKPAVDALMEGRAATVAKYQVGDVLERLNAEPVRTVKALTAPKDASIGQLRSVVQHVPDQAAVIARGYLEDLLDQPQKVVAWRKLGSETKSILFPKAGQAEALDHFFTLTDRISKTNVNPSGSGYVAALSAQGGMVWFEPYTAAAIQLSGATLSALLRSPVAISALTRGLSLPASAPIAARTAATANLMRAASAAGVPLPMPAAADSQP